MKLIPTRISDYVGRFINPVGAAMSEIKKEMVKDNGKRISLNLTKYRTFQADMQQDGLKQAILFAEDPIKPDRSLLLAIYKEVMRDPHLLSTVRTNILKCIGSPWAIFDEGTDTIDEDAMRFMQKLWFNRVRYLYHETPFFGNTLLEFQQMIEPRRESPLAMEFDKVKVFPREFVRPETGEIFLDPNFNNGIPYREAPWNTWLLEIGDSHDIGLLNILAREVIWKMYSRTDWSRRSEKFGMPIVIVKTSTQKTEELDKLETMASTFGTNLWMILDDQDDFQLAESKDKDGHQIYKDKADFCNSEISKLVSGQEATTMEKAFVGSAEVQERILNEYIEEAMRNETFFNNDELFPFLIRHGYPLEGKEFRYLKFMNEEDDSGAEQDEDEPPTPPDKDKKKTTANFTEPLSIKVGKGETGTLTDRVNSAYHSSCCNDKGTFQGFETLGKFDPTNSIDLEKAVNKSVKKVYNKKLKAGQVDREVFLGWANEIYRGVLEGYGTKLDSLTYGSNDHIMLSQLRHNAHVFSIFKNHDHVNELVKALVDDNGNTRSFAQFKKAAGLVNSKYNKNWLKTEHTQAILSARNAKRWQVIERRKDIFPNVEYIVVNDDRLSQICADLAGGIWSIDDPILDRISPSNHFGCRSFLKSTKKGTVEKTTGEDIQEAFNNNPGKSGEIFSEGHPYYTVKGEYKQAASNLFGMAGDMPIGKKQLADNIKSLNKLNKENYGEVLVFPDSGGWMAVHKLADAKDLAANTKVAKAMAQRGYAVEVRKHLQDGKPNPELRVNGALSDLKSPAKPYSLDSLLRKASQSQGINNVVYQVIGKQSLKDIAMGLKRGFHNRSKIQWVDVVQGSKVVRITREMYVHSEMLKELRRGLE